MKKAKSQTKHSIKLIFRSLNLVMCNMTDSIWLLFKYFWPSMPNHNQFLFLL